MFFLRKSLFKRAVFAGLVLVLLTGFSVISCSDDPSSSPSFTVPQAIRGTWVSEYGELYEITKTTFSTGTADYNGFKGYRGTIVNFREDDGDPLSGYITIKYTKNDNNSGAIGNYYVIRYENLGATAMEISGAYDGGDPWKSTKEEAEEAFSVEESAFGMVGGMGGFDPFLQRFYHDIERFGQFFAFAHAFDIQLFLEFRV